MLFLSCRLPRLLSAASLLTLLVAGCKTETEPGPEAGTDYYPLALGDYRIFSVVDSVWVNYQRQPVSTYQFRERIAEQFTDASGQPAYRLVRSRRTLPTDPWRDDSVMVISGTASTVQLTRNNRRTVELVFPIRAGRSWNRDAFNGRDLPEAQSRRYLRVNEPFDTETSTKSFHYDHTVTTDDVEDVNLDNPVTSTAKYRQVYAQGKGPVYRQRRRLVYCNGGNCDPSRVFVGQTRVETLVEQGNTP
ncbi:hypothetical protein SAMN02745146_2525 [Hymenobacter daecheongensis DSM 21074]|uniref:Lipoprotein n=1 Tax=Hymenobacter daecheongensis DSM 21074 TaxID=1121955 RepID=A0A1M6HJ21_9BACT|nr:hypothetical protein [Hymenobacter daecheongensis]SHJ22187.1 hypothetical protein SAMN02745146_2525 [Hymenobacter daecheongensis DSM 21074]